MFQVPLLTLIILLKGLKLLSGKDLIMMYADRLIINQFQRFILRDQPLSLWWHWRLLKAELTSIAIFFVIVIINWDAGAFIVGKRAVMVLSILCKQLSNLVMFIFLIWLIF